MSISQDIADEWGMGINGDQLLPIHPPFIPHLSLTMFSCAYLKQYHPISSQLKGIYMHTLPIKSNDLESLGLL